MRTDVEMVSVVVPSFNKARFIRETLESLLQQDDVSKEIIVIDDASTDESWQIISKYADRIIAHRLPQNRGAAHARNYGARIACGGFLMFLDADDTLAPGTLAALKRALDGRSGSVSACGWKKLRQDGEEWVAVPNGKKPPPADGDYVYRWLTNWYIPPCAILWSRDAFEASGGWDEEISSLDDAELMARAFLKGTDLVFAEGGESYYRIPEQGVSLSALTTEESVQSRIRVFRKIGEQAEELGVLPRYREALGRAFYTVAQERSLAYPHLVLECYRLVDLHLGRRPFSGSPVSRFLWRVLGLERKERLSRWLTRRGFARDSRSRSRLAEP